MIQVEELPVTLSTYIRFVIQVYAKVCISELIDLVIQEVEGRHIVKRVHHKGVQLTNVRLHNQLYKVRLALYSRTSLIYTCLN